MRPNVESLGTDLMIERCPQLAYEGWNRNPSIHRQDTLRQGREGRSDARSLRLIDSGFAWPSVVFRTDRLLVFATDGIAQAVGLYRPH